MRRARKLHLWIGVISSVFILIQAVTGLIISEPWIVGQSRQGGMPPMQIGAGFDGGGFGQARGNGGGGQGSTDGNAQAAADPNGGAPQGQTPDGQNQGQGQDQNQVQNQMQGFPNGFQGGPMGRIGDEGGGVVGFIKNLHQGMINGTSFRYITDLIAISLIFMTLTGIYLSVRVLRAQSKGRRKDASVKRPNANAV